MTKEEMLKITDHWELFRIIKREEVDDEVIDYFNKLRRENWLKDHDPDIIYDPVPRDPNKR